LLTAEGAQEDPMAQLGAWRSKWVWIPAVIVVGLVAWRLHSVADHAKQMSDAALARAAGLPIPVRTAQVSSGPVTTVVGATALTAPYDQFKIRIGPALRFRERNPVIKAVLAHDGTHVAPGQVVVELDPTQFELQVVEKQKALESAQAALAEAQAALEQNAAYRDVELANAIEEVRFRTAAVEYNKEESERLDRLYTQENAAVSERLKAATAFSESEAELTKTRVREERARVDIVVGPLKDQAAVQKSASAVESARVELGLAEADLRGCQLRSPFDGYVTEMRVAPGQPIDDDTVMGILMRVDPILVQLDFPQERSDELSLGQSVEVVLDTFPKEAFQGHVARIPVHVDTPKRVVPVMVEIPNSHHRIKVGVSGYARVQMTRQATSAPALSVIDLDTSAMAFVVEAGRAHMRTVLTGPILDTGIVEIAGGLKDGDVVVIYGQQDLRDNEPVDADWERWARRK
jgi:multidrug efflux pump subunit AcrA (membrane-fusion protein)